MVMNKILLFGYIVILLVITGCTTISPDTNPTQPTSAVSIPPVPTPSGTVVSDPLLPMNTTVVVGTGEKQFTASVDSFEIDTPSEPGKQTITIYVAVKNTGTVPVQLVWFSRLTDISGKIHGGIGISHGGNGARSGLIYPNTTEAARDYVVVPDAELAQLSRGAILDVYFMEKKSDTDVISMVPDYHIRWAIDPAVIT